MTCHDAHLKPPVPSLSTRAAVRAFEAFIEDEAFPCVGAKAACERGSLKCFCANDIGDPRDDRRIVEEVQAFAENTESEDLFVSFAVLFPHSPRMSESAFEDYLWQRLGGMHEIDRSTHDWDDSVSDDPSSSQFSMSIGGKAFYVIGLHPDASRPARRFHCPVLVFNLHRQFERLRADGRYERLREAIARRDTAFSGSTNPMLAPYGKSSEARQYSGRYVGEGWVCPFHKAAKGQQQ
jgi:uncharacterized protein